MTPANARGNQGTRPHARFCMSHWQRQLHHVRLPRDAASKRIILHVYVYECKFLVLEVTENLLITFIKANSI
jgi:predicted restriction endonuclease